MPRPRKGAAKALASVIAGKDAPEPEAVDPRLTLDYCKNHRDFYIRNCLKIATKSQGLQPLVTNHTQQVILNAIVSLRVKGIPPRLIVLKSRQVGVSTIAEALMFSMALFNPHFTSLVLAHTKPAAKGLLRMTRRFYKNLPPGLQIGENLSNVHELELENESRVQVEAAGEVRSYSAQGVHLSEFGFMENAKELLTAVMQSVPFDLNSLAIIESTANGVGNKFHEMWLNALAGSDDKTLAPEERGWVPIFIPWFKHEEYRMKPWFSEEDLSSEERRLQHHHALDLSHLAWRRWAVRTNCDGDLDVFRTEYPSTWREAFALSGRPVFDQEGLDAYADRVPLMVSGRDVQPPQPGESPKLFHIAKPYEVSWDESEKRVSFDFVEGGRFRMFKPPNPRHTYIIGADPSEGDPKSDPSPLEVLDQMTLEFVAEWWGRTPPDMLAQAAAWIGKHYGNALIIGEANNHGISFHGQLLAMEYPNIYFRAASEETIAGEITMKPGYWETNKAKHLLFDTGRKYIRERRGAIYSPGLLGEMRTAIYDRKESFTATKIRPQAGHFIDRVMAALMALYAHRGDIEAPLLPLPERELELAFERVRMLRERDPSGASALALDLTGMSEAELSYVLDRRAIKRRSASALGTEHQR